MKTNVLLFALLLLTGCSKTSPEPEFYMSATIDGNNWSANVANSENTNVAAIVSQGLVAVVAGQTVDNNTTSVGVVFPKTIALNQPVAIVPAKNIALAYSISQTDGYSADPARGGSGTLTITRFDETAGVVEGTFAGNAVFNKNSTRVSIANGRFRSAIYTVNVTTPKPGKR